MTRRFTSVWGEKNRGPADRTRPAAAAAETDGESGAEPPGKRKNLRALRLMHERGHLTDADYRARRAAILGRRDGEN